MALCVCVMCVCVCLMQMLYCTANERLEAGHRDGQMIMKRKENVLKGREQSEKTNESQSQMKKTEGSPETRWKCHRALQKCRNKFVFVRWYLNIVRNIVRIS